MAKIAKDQLHMLPHNAEAEEALIGSILLDPDALLRAREVDLQPGDFYLHKMGLLYQAALDLADRFEPVDPLGIADLLDNRQNGQGSQLDAIGGQSELTRLLSDTPSSIYARHYAEIIKRDSRRRAVIGAAAEIAARAQEHDGDLAELYDAISGLLFEAMDRPEAESHLYGTDETLMAYLARQQERADRFENDPQALPRTWWPNLDALINYLRPGQIHLVTAITSVGKTIYLEQIAEANAMRRHRVVYYHLELTHEGMEDRRMARHSGVPLSKIEVEGYSGPEVGKAIDSIKGWHKNLVYVHCPGWTAERIAADIMRLHARGECDLPIVDYLNKIPVQLRAGKNEASAIGDNVETLKNTVERLHVPLVMAAQVNRQYKGNRRPHFDDVKGSSDIEQKVNQIVVLHRGAERKSGDHFNEQEPMHVFVDKNTSGATGEVTLWHRLGRFRFECRAPLSTEGVPM